ncbi:FCS-Like Zinc finger 10-like [Capsicum annuum]|uniref:FCS-Like Zinc finger 10-like n=1 Tax=Capsicum annuum TaxID=4072 RepID=UPI001FB17AF8|nr:FCS-Like Zinc finger 10-like [Capsicum annuum]
MANQSSNCPSTNSTQNQTNKPISSFLGSPRIFNGLLTRSLSDIGNIKTNRGRLYDTEIVTSPNSILDGMQNLNVGNPFGYDRKPSNPITKNTSKFQTSGGRLYDSEGVVSPNSIHDGMQNHNLGNPFGYDRKTPNPITRKPPNKKLESESIGLALVDPKVTSEKSPVLFGAKLKVEIPCSIEVKNTCEDFGEMESSEDYTCVISHGPNPRTTHIFDNCIVERCCGVRKLRENSCKVDHTEGKDI